MKPKTIVTVLLLTFVCVSIAFLVAKESRTEPATSADKPQVMPQPDKQPVPQPPATQSVALEPIPQLPATQSTAPAPASQQAPPAKSNNVIAYYFHTNARCVSCRKIEAYSAEAVTNGFADAIKQDRLVWRVVNVQQPRNRHFVDDYQLYTKSVVLVDVRSGQQVKWKNLDKVWKLLRDKDAFVRYVQQEVRAFLEQQ